MSSITTAPQSGGDAATAENIARTTGSADMKRFVTEVLSDDQWSFAGPAPDGLGRPRLERLQAFPLQ